MPTLALDRVFAAADGLRRWMLVPVARAAPRLVVSRDARVGIGGALLVVTALLSAIVAPGWMLALGPLVWGVPHVLADVRYLVVRPGMHRRPLILASLALGIALSFVIGVRGAIGGAALAVLLSRATVGRKVSLVAALGGLFGLAGAFGYVADVAFAHLHNVIALAFFCAWRRRSSRLYLLPVAAFVAGALFIVAGGGDGLVTLTRLGSFDLELAEDALAPGLDPTAALRLVLLFTFAQSVHYVVWLALVPAEARARNTPPSIRQGARALVSELGPIVLVVAFGAALFFAGLALHDVARARNFYLAAASFHGWLEVGAAMLFIAEGTRDAGASPMRADA